MKTLLFRSLLLGSLVALAGCNSITQQPEGTFEFFEYQGEDARFAQSIDRTQEYYNPILAGFYPDPSICRKGGDYYLVNSSFAYYPGIPIFHSRDLVNWEQIGHVLDRPSQLQLDSIRLDGGIYAPAITYNKQNNTFYLITTCVDGIGNFIVKTRDPRRGWSEPIPLPNVGGIDPSLFFDDDGKAYIVHNDSPAGTPEYSGHRAIWIHNYDTATDQTFGSRQVLVDGGIDKSTQPVWIEGPHLYKINGKYYLMAAEGGTCDNHSEVILTSDHVKGPYKPMAINPILTQRNLPNERPEPITSVGHADLIDTPAGDWYAVFLGCRPYEGGMYNTGRETFLIPVTWQKDVPVILEKGKAMTASVKPEGWKADTTGIRPGTFTGNLTWRDDFTTEKLRNEWLFIRTPKDNWWSIREGKLLLTPTTRSIYAVDAPAFIGHRQQHIDFTATTEMTFQPQSEKELAGLVCYQNERFNIVFGKTLKEGKPTIVVVSSSKGVQKEEGALSLASGKENAPVYLRITGRAGAYSFEISFDNQAWQPVATGVDASILSTEKAGGFTGVVIGMYAAK